MLLCVSDDDVEGIFNIKFSKIFSLCSCAMEECVAQTAASHPQGCLPQLWRAGVIVRPLQCRDSYTLLQPGISSCNLQQWISGIAVCGVIQHKGKAVGQLGDDHS